MTDARSVWQLAAGLYLQVLDCLTTVLFLRLGAKEANPIIAVAIASHGVAATLIVKLLAMALLFVLCWKLKRMKAVRWSNCLYAALVTWNIVVCLVML